MLVHSFLMMLLGKNLALKNQTSLSYSFKMQQKTTINLVKTIFLITLGFELFGTLVFLSIFQKEFSGLKALWIAVFQSTSAFNNAGFTLLSKSLLDFSGGHLIIPFLSILIILGGLGYQVLLELFFYVKHSFQRSQEIRFFSLHTRLVLETSLILLILGTAYFFFFEGKILENMSSNFFEKLNLAFFHSTTPRTAGFNLFPINQFSAHSILIFLVLMLIGASPGSTGGGIKTTTCRICFASLRTAYRHQDRVVIYQRFISQRIVIKSFGVLVGYLILICSGTFLLLSLEQEKPFLSLFFEVCSAFGTAGLSLGVTSHLRVISQICLCFFMLIGRLGVLFLLSSLLLERPQDFIRYLKEGVWLT